MGQQELKFAARYVTDGNVFDLLYKINLDSLEDVAKMLTTTQSMGGAYEIQIRLYENNYIISHILGGSVILNQCNNYNKAVRSTVYEDTMDIIDSLEASGDIEFVGKL